MKNDHAIHTIPIFEKDISSKSIELFSEIRTLSDNLVNSNITVVPGNRATKLGIVDARRAIAMSAPSSSLGLIYRNTILDACGHAELYGSTGSAIALLAAVEITRLSRVRKDSSIDINELAYAYRIGSSECFDVIRSIVHDKKACDISESACKLSGPSGSIKINRDKFKSSVIELKNGYNFPVGIVPEFSIMTGKSTWSAHEAFIILIDGIIESVGEVHHVLEAFSKNKKKCLIIARGFSEEVIATIATNFNRGTLDIIPALAKGDLEGINILADLSVACLSDVVSSLKGELISSIEVDDIKTVQKVSINNSRLQVVNAASDIATKVQIKRIQEMRDACDTTDKIELFNKRIMSLSASNVEINLGHDVGDDIGILSDRVDICIRMFNDIAQYGIIDLHQLLKNTRSLVIKRICKKLIGVDIHKMSVRSMHAGIMASQSISTIMQSNVFVVEDNES